MLGTLVNVVSIIAGSLVGLLFKGRISEKYNKTIIQSISLGVILIGFKSAFQCDDFILISISLAIGSLIGEICKIEYRLENAGEWIEKKFSKKSEGFAAGFVTTSLIYCVGAMAIVGSLESGLTGNHQTLFAKSVLDGVTSVIFASTMGLGVIFSSVAVFLYQGMITLTAVFMKNFLVPETIGQMTSVGGLLIMAIGFNMLKITTFRVGNMIPAIFLPLVYFALLQLFA